MRGSYDIRVSVARVQFKLTLTRNITILKGKSASCNKQMLNAHYLDDRPFRAIAAQVEASGIAPVGE